MRIEVIISDFIANIKTWIRSKGTLFWTLAFPIILILIFGAIFSGSDTIEYDLHIQDLDKSEMSQTFFQFLGQTGVLKIVEVDTDENIDSYIKENDIKRLIVIPQDYQQKIIDAMNDTNLEITLSYYFDPSELSSNQIVRGVLSGVVQAINMNMTKGRTVITVEDISTITEDFGYIDFFVPGMIGFTIMQSCIYGSIERNTKFRKDGILRKLLTTPMTRSEWIFSKMLFMVFLSFVSTFIIILVGNLVYGLNVHLNLVVFVLVIGTSFLFSGIGMLIGRFVKEEETADTAGGAISFPMMFLAGTFFPLDQMPEFLQIFARVLPLYYVNEGFRNAMIYMKTSDALFYTSVVVIFACVFFISGLLLTKWKED